MITFIICATISAVGIVVYLLQAGSACFLIRKKGRAAPVSDRYSDSFPPVSILKPLRGLDDNLFDNLSSFCTQDYPEYELLLSLQDHNDPAYKIAKNIREQISRSSWSDVQQGSIPKSTISFPHTEGPVILTS
jgi:ceramide glucosyltransferase